MTLGNTVSILLGFLTIALLSSVFAGIHGAFYAQSAELLGHPSPTRSEVIQLILKLAYVCLSCVIGGIVTTWISKSSNANLIVGSLITGVIGWLWTKTVYPIWFWGLLIAAVIPCVMLGYTFLKKVTVSSEEGIIHTKQAV